jgi:uracil-DNA glycosylase
MEEIEKEAKPKEYSQEYISELLEAVRQYVPPHVMDNLHRQALPRAGGKASGKARAAAAAQAQSESAQAATEARQAQATQADVNAEQGVEKQPLPSNITPIPQATPMTTQDDLTPPSPPQLQGNQNNQSACAPGDETCENQTTGSGAQTSNATPNATPNVTSKKKMSKEEVEKAVSDSRMAQLAAEIKGKSTKDLTTYNWRLAQHQGAGNTLKGFTQADMDTFKSKIKQELASRSDDTKKSDKPSDEDLEKCHFNTVDAIASDEDKKNQAEKSVKKETAEEADADCEKVKANCMKLKNKKSLQKTDVITHIGKRPILTFVIASPGVVESIRKSALVGATGKIFNDEYLTPLGLTREDIAIVPLVPQLLKEDDGKVREPMADEIEAWQPWFRDEIAKVESKSKRKIPIIALGHTVKKALERDVEFTMPHPNSLGTWRTDEEFARKRLQVSKALEARYRKN